MSDRPDSIVPGTRDAGRSEGSWCWMGPGPSVETGSPRVLVSRRLCEVLLKHRRGRNYSARKTRRASLRRLPLSSSWNDGGGLPRRDALAEGTAPTKSMSGGRWDQLKNLSVSMLQS